MFGSILNINCFNPSMSRAAFKKKKNVAVEIAIFIAMLFILLGSSINIATYINGLKVLGAEAKTADTEAVSQNDEFWADFLTKNPDYIPGWIEIGKTDKAREIDPNYF